MNMNVVSLKQGILLQRTRYSALNVLFDAKKTSKMDCYVPGLNICTYDKNSSKNSSKNNISSLMLDMINFEFQNCSESENSFLISGFEFSKDQIPDIDRSRCKEIKAENNRIIFNTGRYYKFSDSKGNTHAMSCSYGSLGQLYSNTSRGIVDDESYNTGEFWNMLAENGTYMSLYYSHDIQKQKLNDAGISEGFFSVQMDSKKREYYYSNGICGVAVPKSRYDADYNMFMSGNSVLNDYKEGSIFKISGKEYILGADKKLDIPYGADIYDMKYPPRSDSNW
ncbi:hypothetical protein [Anaerosporobacter sp.]